MRGIRMMSVELYYTLIRYVYIDVSVYIDLCRYMYGVYITYVVLFYIYVLYLIYCRFGAIQCGASKH